jgi:hypothetical protein
MNLKLVLALIGGVAATTVTILKPKKIGPCSPELEDKLNSGVKT